MGYLDDDWNKTDDRVKRNLGGVVSEEKSVHYEEPAESTEAEDNDHVDFMTSEERRTGCLQNGLEAALDAINAAGGEEAFNIARNLYETVRNTETKALLDKYL